MTWRDVRIVGTNRDAIDLMNGDWAINGAYPLIKGEDGEWWIPSGPGDMAPKYRTERIGQVYSPSEYEYNEPICLFREEDLKLQAGMPRDQLHKRVRVFLPSGTEHDCVTGDWDTSCPLCGKALPSRVEKLEAEVVRLRIEVVDLKKELAARG